MNPADLPWWGWLLCAGVGGILSLALHSAAESAPNPEYKKVSDHFATCEKCRSSVGSVFFCDKGKQLMSIPETVQDHVMQFFAWICTVGSAVLAVIALIRFVKWAWQG